MHAPPDLSFLSRGSPPAPTRGSAARPGLRARLLLLGALLGGAACVSTDNAPGVPSTSVAPRPPAHTPERSALRPVSGGVFYEVFVRSFRDSDGDGIGDLRGLIGALDELNDGDPATDHDLGVDGLWLMPIHPSPSYHGYDVTDYRGVHPDYGTLADLDALLHECHRRGMRVILDFVLNHTSSEHPFFQAALAGDPRYRDFYRWRAAPDATWRRPWDGAEVWHRAPAPRVPCTTPGACARAAAEPYYYALFWSGMPDLALTHEAARIEMLESMRFWLRRGVDGFRLDAVRHLAESEGSEGVMLADSEETHGILRGIRREIEAEFPEAVLVGEAWSESAAIARYRGEGDELHLAFSFGVAAGLRQALQEGQRGPLRETVDEVVAAFGRHLDFQAPFLGNHDMPRVARALGGDRDALALAHALLLAWPGTPFLYYGDEVGMQGGTSSADPDKRTPMRWQEEREGRFGFSRAATPWHTASEAPGTSVAAQVADPTSLHATLRDLIRLRARTPALRAGDLRLLEVRGGGRGAFALARGDPASGEQLVLVGNLQPAPAELLLAWPAEEGPPVPLLARGLREAPAPDERAGAALRVSLAGRGFAFFALRQPPRGPALPTAP